jgi:hypothetical protein
MLRSSLVSQITVGYGRLKIHDIEADYGRSTTPLIYVMPGLTRHPAFLLGRREESGAADQVRVTVGGAGAARGLHQSRLGRR